MMVLLLNSTYQPMNFISIRKAIKHLVKGKVEVLSSWNKIYKWGSGSINIPSIIRMKYQIRWVPYRSPFSREALFRRDNWTCQYCGKKLQGDNITIDHVVPRCLGGRTNWLNCLTSCKGCNMFKGKNTPSEAGMRPITWPKVPYRTIRDEMQLIHPKHEDWEYYV